MNLKLESREESGGERSLPISKSHIQHSEIKLTDASESAKNASYFKGQDHWTFLSKHQHLYFITYILHHVLIYLHAFGKIVVHCHNDVSRLKSGLLCRRSFHDIDRPHFSIYL